MAIEPFEGMGVAAFALVTSMLTGMVKAGDGDAALGIVAAADGYLSKPGFDKSAAMASARDRLASVERALKLLVQPPGSSSMQ